MASEYKAEEQTAPVEETPAAPEVIEAPPTIVHGYDQETGAYNA